MMARRSTCVNKEKVDAQKRHMHVSVRKRLMARRSTCVSKEEVDGLKRKMC
jgi:hypothetical protein